MTTAHNNQLRLWRKPLDKDRAALERDGTGRALLLRRQRGEKPLPEIAQRRLFAQRMYAAQKRLLPDELRVVGVGNQRQYSAAAAQRKVVHLCIKGVVHR